MLLHHGVLQFAESDVLNLAVDTEHRIAARLGLPQTAFVFQNMAAPVFQNAPTARAPSQLALQHQLHAFLAIVVHAGKADELRGYFSGGVEASVFWLQQHAGHAHLLDQFRLFWRQLPLQRDIIV